MTEPRRIGMSISNDRKIVAICQIHNEDIYIKQVLRNIIDFCDFILVANHKSTDNTEKIVKELAEVNPKIKYQEINHPRVAHEMIRAYAGTPTWIFPVDGDEIYDPKCLPPLRESILKGDYDRYRQIYGNSFHCTEIDNNGLIAMGYLSPPSRTVTKLYNFGALVDWKGPVTEKCLGGEIIFQPGYKETDNYSFYDKHSWDDSPFRLLHCCFVKRSSKQAESQIARPQVGEVDFGGPITRLKRFMKKFVGEHQSSPYKFEKYQKGDLVRRDVSLFFKDV